MKKIIFLILVILSFGIKPAFAADETTAFVFGHNPNWLYLTDDSTFTVVASDQVSGGCWTSVKASQNAIALELQRSGYNALVPDGDKLEGNAVFLTVLGYRSENSQRCSVTWELEVWFYNVSSVLFKKKHKVIRIGRSQLWDTSGILTGPKSDMSERIKTTFVEAIQKFLVEIPKQRKETLDAIISAAKIIKDDHPEAFKFWSSYALD